MKTATALQHVTRTLAIAWVETLSRVWTCILVHDRAAWAAMAAVRHRQRPQGDCVPHPPARTFGMLVESDVLGGRRHVVP